MWKCAARARGAPTWCSPDAPAKWPASQGVREIPLSLSYTHTDAVACAMAITEESVAATERRRDPMEELTRQFKDARALLDDLPGAPAAG